MHFPSNVSFFFSLTARLCAGLFFLVGCDSGSNSGIPDHHNISSPTVEFTVDGNWQGMWAWRTWLSKRADATALHKKFLMPSAHYLNEIGNVVGGGTFPCIYDENESGAPPFTWKNAATFANQASLAAVGNDLFVFSPLSIGAGTVIEKIDEQGYSLKDFTQRNGMEIFKVSSEFLFNSNWSVDALDDVPQGSLPGCAAFGWALDEETDQLEVDAFAAIIPFVSSAGENAAVRISLSFKNTATLEERVYKNTYTDEPQLGFESVTILFGDSIWRADRAYDVERIELSVLSIGERSVDLQISGKLNEGSMFIANGSVYLDRELWIPQ